jgi:hypothetical protein
MTFKECDKIMKSFRPDVLYCEDRLTRSKPWHYKKYVRTTKYIKEEIDKMQQTNRVARSIYILCNSGPMDVYTNYDPA